MSTLGIETTPPAEPKLRIWPAVLIIALQWIALKAPESWYMGHDNLRMNVFMFAPMVVPALFLIWWLFFSRTWILDRWLLLVVFLAIGMAAVAVYDKTMAMGIMFIVLPVVLTAWVAWLLLTPWMSWSARCAGLAVVFIASWGYFASIRFDGVFGDFQSTTSFRWEPTNEKLFLAERSKKAPQNSLPGVVNLSALALSAGDWPAFRGANRDARLAGVTIATNWSANPPKKLWSHRVGPGWSSVTVIGNRLFTQEQRDKDEVVVCYDADTGAEIWTHIDDARFEEPVAGAGPRATPTFHEGRLFTMGAAGNLNCLDAATGKVIWVRDVLKDAGATNQMWGLAASPLVHQGIVTVYAPCPRKDTSGVEDNPEEKAVLGYRESTGELAWSAAKGAHCYTSAQLNKLNGVEQVLFLSDAGLYSLEPASGKVLWHYDWPTTTDQAARIVQPAVVGESDVLVGTPFEKGTRRVHVDYDGDKWSTKDVWESETFKPYFNDFVVHDGHLYGFNGNFFTCLSLADGSVKWKERGYGSGQALLLADQNLLVVLTEKGEVALLETNPGKRTELARIPALEGKTWNHPVIAHGKLFVRNGAEMACFQLSPK
jgi:outer membrane protein assembly factor BamB